LFGQLADWIGPVNALILAMLINALGMLVIWPVSDSLGPLIAFVILGGMTAGEFDTSDNQLQRARR
jgi:MFS family permease